jgi:hypothetical protein
MVHSFSETVNQPNPCWSRPHSLGQMISWLWYHSLETDFDIIVLTVISLLITWQWYHSHDINNDIIVKNYDIIENYDIIVVQGSKWRLWLGAKGKALGRLAELGPSNMNLNVCVEEGVGWWSSCQNVKGLRLDLPLEPRVTCNSIENDGRLRCGRK